MNTKDIKDDIKLIIEEMSKVKSNNIRALVTYLLETKVVETKMLNDCKTKSLGVGLSGLNNYLVEKFNNKPLTVGINKPNRFVKISTDLVSFSFNFNDIDTLINISILNSDGLFESCSTIKIDHFKNTIDIPVISGYMEMNHYINTFLNDFLV